MGLVHMSTPERRDNNSKNNTKTLRIINTNFQSIKTKLAEFTNLINSVQLDVIFGTETWMDNSIKDSQIITPGYNVYHKDRHINGGGVFVAVKNNLSTVATPELETNCEIVGFKLALLGHKSPYFESYFISETSNHEGYTFLRDILEMACSVNNACILVAGDFNLPGIDWEGKCTKAVC